MDQVSFVFLWCQFLPVSQRQLLKFQHYCPPSSQQEDGIKKGQGVTRAIFQGVLEASTQYFQLLLKILFCGYIQHRGMLRMEYFLLLDSLGVLLAVEKGRRDICVDNGQSMSQAFIIEFCLWIITWDSGRSKDCVIGLDLNFILSSPLSPVA